ncbi:MAG: glycosyltransferase family 39 protein [Terracidiphilus sp.]
MSDLTADPIIKSKWWTPGLAGPIVAAALIRLSLLIASLVRTGTNGIVQPDTASYLIPGRNLVLHGCYFADGVPNLFRPPGYSLFLSIFSLAGLPAAAIANVVLSVITVVLVWRLGRMVFGDDRIALVAAWLFAFEPMSVVLSIDLLSETLFLALFLLSVERVAAFLRGNGLRSLAGAGLSLAAATYTRPTTYYLPIALALGLILVFMRVPGLRWKAPAVLLISALSLQAAWQVRNWVETGYGGFSSMREVNLYIENAAEVTSIVEHRDYFEVRKELGFLKFTDTSGQIYLSPTYVERHPEQAGWNSAQRIAFMRSAAESVLRAHRGVYLRTWVRPVFAVIFDPGAGYFDHVLNLENARLTSRMVNEGALRWGLFLAKTYPWIVAEKAAFGIVLLGLYFLAARGVLRCGARDPVLWLMLGTTLYFIAVFAVAGSYGADARFRLPIMPVVCIFAAAGVWRPKTTSQ